MDGRIPTDKRSLPHSDHIYFLYSIWSFRLWMVSSSDMYYYIFFVAAGVVLVLCRVIEYLSIRRFPFGRASLWLSPINFTGHVNAQYRCLCPSFLCTHWPHGCVVHVLAGVFDQMKLFRAKSNRKKTTTTTTKANAERYSTAARIGRRAHNKY